jgi:hypothetical protein
MCQQGYGFAPRRSTANSLVIQLGIDCGFVWFGKQRLASSTRGKRIERKLPARGGSRTKYTRLLNNASFENRVSETFQGPQGKHEMAGQARNAAERYAGKHEMRARPNLMHSLQHSKTKACNAHGAICGMIHDVAQ